MARDAEEGWCVLTEFDDVVKATAALAKRAGAVEFSVYYRGIAPKVQWFAAADFNSDGELNTVVGEGTDVGWACHSLSVRLLEGAVCGRCNHVISLVNAEPIFCQWRREGDVWVSGCGMPRDNSIELRPKHA